jgi:hypothetical protein
MLRRTHVLTPLIVIAMVAMAGCAKRHAEPVKAAVTGRVTLDGAPLATGEVFFISKKGESADRLAIKDGSFAGRVTVGPQAVQITSLKVVGKAPRMPGEVPVDVFENTLPAKYGPGSALVAEIKPGSNEPLVYELQSEPKTAAKPAR